MIILKADNLSLSFGVNDIFFDISFSLKKGSRMGLIGSNGSGKTSLMKIISGHLHKTSGEIKKSDDTVIHYLSQLSDYTSTLSVWEDVMSIYDDVFEMESKLRELEHKMAENTDNLEKLTQRYATLTEKFEALGGYAAERMARSVLAGLGIKSSMYSRRVSTLSGGQRARVQLAMALLRNPDILLLDEPTNHLDLDATKWLENFLAQSNITLIIVSHDRYFLDNVCSDIMELSMGKITLYKNCNYSKYLIEREAKWEQQQKLYKANQAEIKRHEAIIRRYRSWDTEKSIVTAKSWEKRLAKLERVERPVNEKIIKFRFNINNRSGNDVFICNDLSKSFNKKVFDSLNLHIRAGEKVALMGPNGVGKTTLLKIIAGAIKPDGGDYILGSGINLGYYDQHQQNLTETNTAQDEIWDAYHELTPQQVRDVLALFLFTGDDIRKPVSVLSGGERGRLSLLKLMLSRANFLLLDEPTNHLDMDSRQVLETALFDFPGTVLFVSHDRYFINSIATKILDMTPHGITSYEGTWDEYQYHLSQKYEEDEKNQKESKTERAKRYKQMREEKEGIKKLKHELSKVEKKIFDCEIKKATAEKRLSDVAELNDIDISTYSKQYHSCEVELQGLMERWEELSSALSLKD